MSDDHWSVEGGKWLGREGYSNIAFPNPPATPSSDRTCNTILWCQKNLLKKFESESDIFLLKTQNSYFQLTYCNFPTVNWHFFFGNKKSSTWSRGPTSLVLIWDTQKKGLSYLKHKKQARERSEIECFLTLTKKTSTEQYVQRQLCMKVWPTDLLNHRGGRC